MGTLGSFPGVSRVKGPLDNMYVDYGMLCNVKTQILKFQYIYNIGV
jgi:hypothetical protein